MADKIRTHKTPKTGNVHGHDAKYVAAHASEAKRIRNSHRWHEYRLWYRKHNPVCVDPFNDHADIVVQMDHVHHIKPLASYPSLAFKAFNCAALCEPCHHKIESLERRGKATEQLFACE